MGGIEECPGPCDVRPIQGRSPFTSPQRPAAVYKRGQRVTIKYQRNNHGPGGFVRHTLVPINKMMDKKAHENNAFHFGCWGADPVAAKPSEMGRDTLGFSLVGGDGKLHNLPISYYTTVITIPPVVPDGKYVLGWTWYGGIGGSIHKNLPRNPNPQGHFADYWSCSFVEIRGGEPVKQKYTPVFVPAYQKYWRGGCYSMNDRPGVCIYEPCRNKGSIMKPKEFQGKTPQPLTPQNFKGSGLMAIPTPVPESNVKTTALKALSTCEKKIAVPLTGKKTDTLKNVLISLFMCRKKL